MFRANLTFWRSLVLCFVSDRPSPPSNVRVASCTRHHADVLWTPGSDSNEQVTMFIVYYNSSHDEAGKFHEAARVNSSSDRARVQMQPWTSYTFHVMAENAVGISDRSEFSQVLCIASQAEPHRNPHRVCTESRDPETLVIVWEVSILFWGQFYDIFQSIKKFP